MRGVAVGTIAFIFSAWAAVSALASKTEPEKIEHPSNVALIQDDSGWRYVHFPSNLRLYVFDHDSTGKSACNSGCDGAWPPLIVAQNEKPVGDWTIIDRYDGSKQWAYKGHPVYLRFHDSLDEPTGNGLGGVWHFLEP
jgi:predicted lipoprotein with Yx(FWY)xxD motif